MYRLPSIQAATVGICFFLSILILTVPHLDCICMSRNGDIKFTLFIMRWNIHRLA
jgi:hypothetical protein